MNRLALKPNSARGGSIGILFNKRRTSCLANPVGYGGILSSSEQQEQERNTHYTFFKLTIDGRQWLHFLSLTLKIICTRENENYEKLLATAPTAFMPHQPEEARQPWLAQPHSISRNPRVVNSCDSPLAILCRTPWTKVFVSPSSQWLPGPFPPCRAASEQQCWHSSRTSICLKKLKNNYALQIHPEQWKLCVHIQV